MEAVRMGRGAGRELGPPPHPQCFPYKSCSALRRREVSTAG